MDLLEEVINIARQAGQAIMEVYGSDDFEVEVKKDGNFESPLTKADKTAHDIIEAGLRRISDLPIISEEGSHDFAGADKFWLVDPLDGTKEFIKKNGEFTVNIALIEHGSPILGVVDAPAKGLLYAGEKGKGSYKTEENGQKTEIGASFKGQKPVIIASRSHRDKRLDKLLSAIGEHEEISMGSSLKLCLIAEGKAQIYPRLAPTYLWDTAAADAVLRAAGGRITDTSGRELTYNPAETLKNPFFVATAGNDTLFEANKNILKGAES